MGKHTQGPWECGKGYGLHGVEIVGDSGNRMVCGVIGVTQNMYGKDARKVGELDTPDGWANARLIAAAPELLEALIGVVAVADRATAEFDAARAAIAKATGAPHA